MKTTLMPYFLGRYYGAQFRRALQAHVAKVARLNREYARLLK